MHDSHLGRKVLHLRRTSDDDLKDLLTFVMINLIAIIGVIISWSLFTKILMQI